MSDVAEDHDHHGDEFDLLVLAVQDSLRHSEGAIFQTEGDQDLFQVYLNSLPVEDRQYYNCNTCKQFIKHFGGLVTVDAMGLAIPVMWDLGFPIPEFFRPTVRSLQFVAQKHRIVSPFLTTERVWGTPRTGEWTHFAVTPSSDNIYTGRLLTPHQAMAAKQENYRTVARALGEYTVEVLQEALRVLESEALSRSDRFVEPIRWLLDLAVAKSVTQSRVLWQNLLWKAVATAPAGFCHPRSSVVGTLLEDIAGGLDFDAASRRWKAKVHPLAYQRPKAAPKLQNVQRAEEIVAKLGIEPALHRRFARIDEVELSWVPKPTFSKPESGGVFDHLKPRARQGVKKLELPATDITWERFKERVLPGAERIELRIGLHNQPFAGITTAVNEDAPLIFKWDNPFAWYLYHGGSTPDHWNLSPGWIELTGIMPLPNLWGDNPQSFLYNGVILLLRNARDVERIPGNSLFPEMLKGELHEVRSTIEAFSKSQTLHGAAEATACGWKIGSQSRTPVLVRVNGTDQYRIDRWE